MTRAQKRVLDAAVKWATLDRLHDRGKVAWHDDKARRWAVHYRRETADARLRLYATALLAETERAKTGKKR